MALATIVAYPRSTKERRSWKINEGSKPWRLDSSWTIRKRGAVFLDGFLQKKFLIWINFTEVTACWWFNEGKIILVTFPPPPPLPPPDNLETDRYYTFGGFAKNFVAEEGEQYEWGGERVYTSVNLIRWSETGYMQRDAGAMNYLWLRLVNNCEKM